MDWPKSAITGGEGRGGGCGGLNQLMRFFLCSSIRRHVKEQFGQHADNRRFVLKASPAFGRRRFHQKKKSRTILCFCAFVLAPASFLTFGKVNPGPLQTDIFCPPLPSLPALFLTGKVNCHRHFGGGGPQTDIFWERGERGGVQNRKPTKANMQNEPKTWKRNAPREQLSQ